MSLQTIIESAVNIDINRSKLIAQTVSRSGKLLTASRNWVNPFRLTITPKPIWLWSAYRDEIQTVLDNDRYASQYIYLYDVTGGTSKLSWLAAYQGGLDATSDGVLDNTVGNATTPASGTSIYVTYSGSSTGVYMVKKGDWIRFNNNNFPYLVTADVLVSGAGNYTIPVHRGFLDQINTAGTFTVGQKYVIASIGTTDFTLIGAASNTVGLSFTATGVGTGTGTATYDTRGSSLRVGPVASRMLVQVTKLPALKYSVNGYVEFTDTFELTEVIA